LADEEKALSLIVNRDHERLSEISGTKYVFEVGY
jgi:hypothetical protein